MNISKISNNYFSLEKKVIVVTGGVGLMGEKHAEAIMEFGGIPLLLDIDDKKGRIIEDSLNNSFEQNCKFIKCDITKEEQVKEINNWIVSKFNRIDGLINNAAINPKYDSIKSNNKSRLENFDISKWNEDLSVGLTGALICSKVFGYEMSKSNGGVILNISSDLGLIAPDQRIYEKVGIASDEQPVKPVSYSIIKHGLIGLTKYLSTYWNDKGVRCNSLCPGGIYTGQDENFVNNLTKLIPLGRMASKNEYKAVIVFLLSSASNYMTGSHLVIDGGRTAW
jgi:NAD(P)-dependent dehydrogenase (short-subunit alcohol dehydrogenase family)